MNLITFRSGARRDLLLGLGMCSALLLAGCTGKDSQTNSAGSAKMAERTATPESVPGAEESSDKVKAQSDTQPAPDANRAEEPAPSPEMPAVEKQDNTNSDTAKPGGPETVNSLHDACFNGAKEMVEKELKRGADVNKPDEGGRTPLMLAAYNGHTAIVRSLLQQGAKVNVQDAEGRTALMYAATGPYVETVQQLLDHEAKVNIQDGKEHWSALMFAAAEGQAEVVKALLKSGANASLRDVDGDTAANFARNNGHAEVVKLLQAGPS